MDVRPAARIARRKDRRERDSAARIGFLHAAKRVLMRDRRCVQRVATFPIAVPDVDRALDLARKTLFDLLILDVMLPASTA